ncbi:DSD1 family PLP-dependent enzyme [Herminiimonas aquatilis]|uniref:DSD1 family PLP-dependent enzyme n=1 Tax=Herminiimonas aquatilis TaxID=345342 RepID=A0ABW2J6E1_9BURK
MNADSSIKPPPIAKYGDSLAQVSTPALLIELDAFEHNIARMAEMARQHGVALRPHAKAHKSSVIAQKQMAAGAIGICCQKLSEAYPFVAAGISDIYISNEFVGPAKVAMAIELARHIKLSVCVDHIAQIDALGTAASAAGVMITVLVEVDIGQARCGVARMEGLAMLVDGIARHPALHFGGLQAFHGGIQHLATWDLRRTSAAASADKVAAYAQFLAARGIACPVITGSGTGTAEFDAASGVFTEIQPGSYVFMDAHYAANEWSGSAMPRHSLFIAATIMSTAKDDIAVCDVGLKGVAVDSGLPLISPGQSDDLKFDRANDEHGILKIIDHAGAVGRDRLGEQVLLIPGHCDPTANLYNQYVCIRNGCVEDIWNIEARGLSQ